MSFDSKSEGWLQENEETNERKELTRESQSERLRRHGGTGNECKTELNVKRRFVSTPVGVNHSNNKQTQDDCPVIMWIKAAIARAYKVRGPERVTTNLRNQCTTTE